MHTHPPLELPISFSFSSFTYLTNPCFFFFFFFPFEIGPKLTPLVGRIPLAFQVRFFVQVVSVARYVSTKVPSVRSNLGTSGVRTAAYKGVTRRAGSRGHWSGLVGRRQLTPDQPTRYDDKQPYHHDPCKQSAHLQSKESAVQPTGVARSELARSVKSVLLTRYVGSSSFCSAIPKNIAIRNQNHLLPRLPILRTPFSSTLSCTGFLVTFFGVFLGAVPGFPI